jgi:hypothetical protein
MCVDHVCRSCVSIMCVDHVCRSCVSIMCVDHVCWSCVEPTTLKSTFCVDLFVSTFLCRPFCVDLFVSTFLCRPFCVDLFASTFLRRPFCVDLFASTFLRRPFYRQIFLILILCVVPICQKTIESIVSSGFFLEGLTGTHNWTLIKGKKWFFCSHPPLFTTFKSVGFCAASALSRVFCYSPPSRPRSPGRDKNWQTQNRAHFKTETRRRRFFYGNLSLAYEHTCDFLVNKT